jgi:hypothetical protein
VVSLWGIAAVVAQMLGWFAALVTGRLPVWVWQLQTGYLRVAARAGGYLMMLTDLYPSYDHGPDPGYPIRLVLSQPERLNRAAVLFRPVLLVPALVLAQLAVTGWLLASPAGWVWILRTGRAPVAYSQASTAVLRWVLRCQAWATMTTSRYPRRLYGDRDQERQSLTNTSSSVGTLRLSKAADVVLSVFITLGAVAAIYIGRAEMLVATKAINPAYSSQVLQTPRVLQPPQVLQTPPVIPQVQAPSPHHVLPSHPDLPIHRPPPVTVRLRPRTTIPAPTPNPAPTDPSTSKHHDSHKKKKNKS